jgi:hypothetical protein
MRLLLLFRAAAPGSAFMAALRHLALALLGGGIKRRYHGVEIGHIALGSPVRKGKAIRRTAAAAP